MKAAMKAREAQRVLVLRLLLSEIKNFHIERGLDRQLDQEDVIQVLKQGVATREETIETCRQAGRADLVDKELEEVRILGEYLAQAGGN